MYYFCSTYSRINVQRCEINIYLTNILYFLSGLKLTEQLINKNTQAAAKLTCITSVYYLLLDLLDINVLRPCANLNPLPLPNNYLKILSLLGQQVQAHILMHILTCVYPCFLVIHDTQFEIFIHIFRSLCFQFNLNKFDSFTNISFIIGYKLHKVSKFFKIMSYSFL